MTEEAKFESFSVLCNKTSELEKENAELKARLNAINQLIPELEEENEKLQKDLYCALNNFADGYQGSLSIAKEIIREYNDVGEDILIYKKRDTKKIAKIKAKAESFLKECGE